MPEQVLVQARVDALLKDQAAEVFETIGIDMPTGIRMFLKAVVREQNIPFSTAVGDPEKREPNHADRFTEFIRKKVVYDPPAESELEGVIVKLPLEDNGSVPNEMFILLIEKVPAGRITRWEDMAKFLSKLYDKDVSPYQIGPLPFEKSNGESIPYWRVVSERGILNDTRLISREMKYDKLFAEGVPLVRRGEMANSFKVDNFKEYLYNFNELKVVEK